MFITQPIKNTRPFLADRPLAPAKKVNAFPARKTDGNLFALTLMLIEKLNSPTHNIGIKGSAQSAITGDNQQFCFLAISPVQKRMGGVMRPLAKVAHDISQFMGIRTGRKNAVLSPFELSGRHHFHGLRDFLGIFKRRDFSPEAL